MKERELLQRWVSRHLDIAEYHTLKEKTESFLAKPEQKPLTREEISYGFRDNDADLDAESFWAGVKYAEKMHGVNNEISTT